MQRWETDITQRSWEHWKCENNWKYEHNWKYENNWKCEKIKKCAHWHWLMEVYLGIPYLSYIVAFMT